MNTFYALEQATHQRIQQISQQKAQINLAAQVFAQDNALLQSALKWALTALILKIFHPLSEFKKNLVAASASATAASKSAALEQHLVLPNSTQVRS